MTSINGITGNYQQIYASATSAITRGNGAVSAEGSTNQASLGSDQLDISEEGRMALENAKNDGNAERPKAHGPLGDLVESGVITSEQRDTIKLAIDAAHQNRPPRPAGDSPIKPEGDPAREEALQKLVMNGTISESQMKDISAAIDLANAQKEQNKQIL